MKNFALLLLMTGILGCVSNKKTAESSFEKPGNIIFLIGDGMGLSAVTTGFYYGEGPSVFNRFKDIGLICTSSATHRVTDSGASGTAMATGVKTYNGAIGVDSLKNSVRNITEVLSDKGFSTGLVVTSSITHATPACFYAHVERRNMEEIIASQLLDSEIDFFAGGGIRFFSRRRDGKDLLSIASEKGFIIDTSALKRPENPGENQKFGFLLADNGMPPAARGRGGFLPDATDLAIQDLSANGAGFFLMVEGSQIDWAGHENNVDYLVTEMLDFEKAIGAAMDFAEKDGHTLVVVTADHETGGFTLSGYTDEKTGHEDYSRLGPSFATRGHSATLIPVFAYGPGAEEFKGIYENSDLFHKMVSLAVLPE
jgi:alkaline phosphatase